MAHLFLYPFALLAAFAVALYRRPLFDLVVALGVAISLAASAVFWVDHRPMNFSLADAASYVTARARTRAFEARRARVAHDNRVGLRRIAVA